MNRRIALVTGGIGGIGSEICRRLARDGMQVTAVDLPPAPGRLEAFQAGHPGLDIGFEAADVADFDSCRGLLERMMARHGRLDVLVNAAGITRDAMLRKMEREQWEAVMAVNLDSVFNLCRLCIEGMCERGFGRIVNISSVNGQTGQFGQTNYAAAKAGMHGFTMALAREVGRKGVTVNSVSPGYIQTAMTDAVPDAVREQVVGMIPVGRMGQPVDIARAVSFLCADDAGYLTGVNLPVNGGLFISF